MHNLFIMYVLVKFGKESNITVKNLPNGAIKIAVKSSGRVLYERNLTTVR